MPDHHSRLSRALGRITTILLMAVLMVPFGQPTPEAAALLPAPAGVTVHGVSGSRLGVSFGKVKGAVEYRVRYSTKANMSGARQVDTKSTSVVLKSLKPATTYYIRVKALKSKKKSLTSYQRAVTARTLAKSSLTQLVPASIAVKASKNSLAFSWPSVGKGITYELKTWPAGKISQAKVVRTTSTKATVKSLAAGSKYGYKLRIVNAKKKALSVYTPTRTAKTTPATSVAPPAPGIVPPGASDATAPLVVASYNIRCTNCVTTLRENEEPWEVRRPVLAAAIRAQRPAVIGLQEASQARLLDDAGAVTNTSQFEDLLAELGTPWKPVNKARYNCDHPSTTWKCEPKDQGASKGTKIAYDSTQATPLRNGSLLLPKYEDSGERYAAWAEFTHLASGKGFFFVTTHLESKGDSGSSTRFYQLRVKQMTAIIAMIKKHNTRNLPVVLSGDWNSQKFTKPANGPYDVAVAAGYVDPLGNTYESKVPAGTATVEKRIRTNYASANGFRRLATKKSVVNAPYLDYIFTSRGVRVAEWETVVNIDDKDNFIGVIPSDHNMIRATLHLP